MAAPRHPSAFDLNQGTGEASGSYHAPAQEEMHMLGRLSRVWAICRRHLADARADRFLRNELAHEFACLEQAGELDGVLNSLGLARGAVPFLLDNYPGALRRYCAMRRRLEIATPEESARSGLVGLSGPRLKCLLCASAHRCERRLRSVKTGIPDFCPNRKAFEQQCSRRSWISASVLG
jgi:hypothetical protein